MVDILVDPASDMDVDASYPSSWRGKEGISSLMRKKATDARRIAPPAMAKDPVNDVLAEFSGFEDLFGSFGQVGA